MSADRLETLKTMVAQDPTNAFAQYGLAMEFVSRGDLQSAVEQFEKVLDVNPDYAAAYFHAGQALEKLARTDDARSVYERGIVVTRRTGDAHTQAELQAALDLL